jgi:hypothetical protein
VYQSNPDAPAAVELGEEFERLAREVYVAVRDGVVDCEAVFDLACWLMEWGWRDPAVEELAALAAEAADRDRIAGLARQVLAASSFEPGFDLEPGRLVVLEEALEAVRSDMQATGLPGPVRLVVPEWSPHACQSSTVTVLIFGWTLARLACPIIPSPSTRGEGSGPGSQGSIWSAPPDERH